MAYPHVYTKYFGEREKYSPQNVHRFWMRYGNCKLKNSGKIGVFQRYPQSFQQDVDNFVNFIPCTVNSFGMKNHKVIHHIHRLSTDPVNREKEL